MSNIEGDRVRIFALTAMMAVMGATNAVAEPPIRPPIQASRPAAPNSVPLPGSAAKRLDQAPPGSLPGQSPEIVVGFKDDAKVKGIVDTFRKDAPAAKARFEVVKKDRPEMADTVLDRVTYSNELVLAPLGKDGPSDGRTATRAIAARLAAALDIAYAEVNATAQIGAQ